MTREEVYRLQSRFFTGSRLDLAEAYAWGWEEFTRVETEMKQVANRIKPGATLAEAAAALDADPRYLVHGKDGLRSWMQGGGTLITAHNASRFPVEFGFARSVDIETFPQTAVNAQKPLIRAEIWRCLERSLARRFHHLLLHDLTKDP